MSERMTPTQRRAKVRQARTALENAAALLAELHEDSRAAFALTKDPGAATIASVTTTVETAIRDLTDIL